MTIEQSSVANELCALWSNELCPVVLCRRAGCCAARYALRFAWRLCACAVCGVGAGGVICAGCSAFFILIIFLVLIFREVCLVACDLTCKIWRAI